MRKRISQLLVCVCLCLIVLGPGRAYLKNREASTKQSLTEYSFDGNGAKLGAGIGARKQGRQPRSNSKVTRHRQG